MNSRIRTPFYRFFLNPDYVAARTLRSLRCKVVEVVKVNEEIELFVDDMGTLLCDRYYHEKKKPLFFCSLHLVDMSPTMKWG